MASKEYTAHLNNVRKRNLKSSPGQLIDNYIYLYHVPGEGTQGIG